MNLGPVLAVDDDPRLLELVRFILHAAGHDVVTVQNGEAALRVVAEQRPSLVLLDIGLPVMDGLTVCRRIREFSQVPVIVVTGKGSEDDKVRGFDAGADDYLTKPFSARELVARVKAVLRRSSPATQPGEPSVTVGDLVLDVVGNKVLVAGKEVPLTGTEHRLLSFLARNAGRVLTSGQILARVWGQEYEGEFHLLRVTVGRLRQKLGDDAREPRYIQTRPGIGYVVPKEPPKQG